MESKRKDQFGKKTNNSDITAARCHRVSGDAWRAPPFVEKLVSRDVVKVNP
jgi:hypothetical protein